MKECKTKKVLVCGNEERENAGGVVMRLFLPAK